MGTLSPAASAFPVPFARFRPYHVSSWLTLLLPHRKKHKRGVMPDLLPLQVSDVTANVGRAGHAFDGDLERCLA
jgi:hypothetical protein